MRWVVRGVALFITLILMALPWGVLTMMTTGYSNSFASFGLNSTVKNGGLAILWTAIPGFYILDRIPRAGRGAHILLGLVTGVTAVFFFMRVPRETLPVFPEDLVNLALMLLFGAGIGAIGTTLYYFLERRLGASAAS